MDGMIWGDLLRTSFLRPCSEYFSPSEKLSKTPAALFCFVTLTSGLMQMLRANWNPQIPTATPTAAKRGYTSGLSHRLPPIRTEHNTSEASARERERRLFPIRKRARKIQFLSDSQQQEGVWWWWWYLSFLSLSRATPNLFPFCFFYSQVGLLLPLIG